MVILDLKHAPTASAPEEPAAASATASTEPGPAGEPQASTHRTGTTGPHPPLDDAELPELVVTEFKGPGPLRPAGLEHTPASADVHAAITPPAGTLIVTPLDEPPPEPPEPFKLEAPVRGDEPLHVPESSFHPAAPLDGDRGAGRDAGPATTPAGTGADPRGGGDPARARGGRSEGGGSGRDPRTGTALPRAAARRGTRRIRTSEPKR